MGHRRGPSCSRPGSAGSLNAVPAGGGDAVVVTQRRAAAADRSSISALPARRASFPVLFPWLRGRPRRVPGHARFDRRAASLRRRIRPRFSPLPIACCSRAKERSGRSGWISPALRPVGEPVPVSTQLALNADLFGDVALSETAPGLIAYRAGAGKRQFRWFDRTGRQIGVLGGPDEGQPSGPRLSPDGRTVMFRRTISGNTDLWSIEASRNVLRRLTSDPARDYDAVWSPGSDRIVFNSDRNGVLNLYETLYFRRQRIGRNTVARNLRT